MISASFLLFSELENILTSQSGDVFVRGTSRLVKLSPDQEHLKRPQSFIYKSEMSQIILALLSEV